MIVVRLMSAIGTHGDRALEQHGVGHDDPLAISLAHMGVANGDLLNLAVDLFALDEVAEAERLAEKDQHAGDEVLEDILEGESDGDRTEANSRHDLARGQ